MLEQQVPLTIFPAFFLKLFEMGITLNCLGWP